MEISKVLEQAKEELRQSHARRANWLVTVFRTAGHPDATLVVASGDEAGDWQTQVAKAALDAHAPAVGEFSIAGSKPVAVLAWPVLDPEVFESSPAMRPVLGVTTF